MKKYRIIQIRDKFYIQEEQQLIFKWWSTLGDGFRSISFYSKEEAEIEALKIKEYNELPEFKIIKEL